MAGEVAIDPVCGMEVQVETSRFILEWKGVVHHFCGPACRRAFQADPAKYMDPTYIPSMG